MMQSVFVVTMSLLLAASVSSEEAPWFCHGINCPAFSNSSVDGIEVRNYGSNRWTSTEVQGVSLDDAMETGFHRLFDYISGANSAGKPIDMTAPVLTQVLPGAGPNCNTTFKVSFFVPFDYQAPNDPPPAPTDSTVFTETIPAMKVAVKSFGGQPKEDAMIAEATLLEEQIAKDDDLEKDPQAGESWWAAGYDPPFRLTNRHNEVWVNII